MTATLQAAPSAPVRTAQDRERVATRLLRSSARHSYDPVADLDWDAPLDPTVPAMPLHRLSLHGTPLWETLDDERRVQLSWHEWASITSVGLWFEIILMQGLLRYVYDQNPHTAHAQYGLTEVGDETRHAVMFARIAEQLAPGARYRASARVHTLGRLFKTLGGGPAFFSATLVAEETLDRLQREMQDDAGILALTRDSSRIHVTEEARHVSYAREAVLRQTPQLGRAALSWHRHVAAIAATLIVDSFVDPAVYTAVGLDAAEAVAQVSASPAFAATRLWMGEKVTAFLREAGMIGGPSTALWRRASLIG
jgi:hypothetical protein